MSCRLCTWLCDRFCPPDSPARSIWRTIRDWEENYAFDWDPWEEDDGLRERWQEAKALRDENPAAALAIHRELAEGGSPFSMLKTGWHYECGYGTEADSAAAEDFYRRALCAGSWRGTLYYADLLFKRGAHDKWPRTLGDGVDKGFIPAFYWLACYRYKRAPSRSTARDVRHLLEAAADAGHPGAQLLLARWTAFGKFGLRWVPRGFGMLRALHRSLFTGMSGASVSNLPGPANQITERNQAAVGASADLQRKECLVES